MYENNNSSNVCNDESDVQHGFKESELAKGLGNFVGQESECSEIKNYSNTEEENVLDKTSKEIDNELDQENNEHKNETNCSENNACDTLNESVKEKDCESEQNDDKAKNQIDNNSDNDTDLINKTIEEKDISNQKEDELKKNNIHNRLFRIIDSDSEEESLFTPKFKKKRFVDEKDEMSNSELDDVSTKNLNKSRTMKLVDSDSDDTSNIVHASDAKNTISNEMEVANSIRSKLQTLIDSESDEEKKESDEEREESDEEPNSKTQNKMTKNKKKNSKSKEKLRKVSLRASKEEAMKQIQSETQRLIRETEISLPYHNPKQRTIQEFLKRRKVISSFPVPTVASKLKEFSSIVDEILKKKEKEAEIFYKSSDSEEEIIESNTEDMNIQCTKNVKKDNVSRKLFDDNLFTAGASEEQSNINIVEKKNGTLIEVKDIECNETIINNRTESNAINSLTIQTHCEASSNMDRVESKNTEIAIGEKSDDLLQEATSQNKNKEKSICIDNDKYNLESLNDNAKTIKEPSEIITNEFDEDDEFDFPPLDYLDSLDTTKKNVQNIESLKPKLRGIPGQVIDLTEDITSTKKGIDGLIDRFVRKHSKSDRATKSVSKVTTTQIKETRNGGLSIIKETLPYRLPYIANIDPKLEKPGAKLMRLKEELKRRMAIKRNEEWKQREQEMKEQEIEWNESINEEDNFNEPYSPNIEPQISEEDEIEEDDAYLKVEKKRKKKNAFIEDEAEVSEDEINDSDDIEDQDQDQDQEEDEDEDEDENEDEHEVQEKDEKSEKLVSENEYENSSCDSNDTLKCKTFKRIVKPLDDDSRSSVIENDKNSIEQSTFSSQAKLNDLFDKNIKNNSMKQSTFSYQAKLNDLFDKNIKNNDLNAREEALISEVHVEWQMNQTPQSKSNNLNFISPITQLTALNVQLEEEKTSTTQEASFVDPIFREFTKTPESLQIKRGISQKKLFADQSAVLDEELVEICSGKFPEDKMQFNFVKGSNVTESQLLELCSGTFSSQPNNNKESVNITGGILQSIQLPDEKDSSNTEIDKKDRQQSKDETTFWNKLRVLSSDEEDSVEKEIKNRPKKRVKKLNLSDDEDEKSSALSSNDDEAEDNEKFIDYDSEENEVIVPKKEIKQYAAKFLEEEAELSESDCDVSADEDEEDLDKLELEDGDNEEIDETKVKNQLGKLHMKQMLDEDKREVRMLQEMLFEEGDLFSESTRERKFRWRNIDKQSDNIDVQPSEDKDGWVDVSDDEDEEKWRKIRLERESFLAEKLTNIDTEIENELNNSHIFKFGLKILKKRRINELQKENTLAETLDDSKTEPKISHTVAEMLNTSKLDETSRTIRNVMKKRSFLAKGEEALMRLATLARRKETPLSSINTKNFVFTHIDNSDSNK